MSNSSNTNIDTLVFGAPSEPKHSTSLADSFDHALSINEFMSDAHMRFRKDYDNALQLCVYFFTDKSVYSTKVDSSYGTHYYQYIRPEMIAFVKLNEKTKKPKFFGVQTELDIYADYGLKFETHIPQRVWDDAAHKFTREVKTNKDGTPVYKYSREINTDHRVNYLLINLKQQKFVKKAGKFDLCENEILYYDWKICYPADTRNEVQYLQYRSDA